MTSSESSIDQICNQYVRDIAAAHPVAATMIGIDGYDDQMTDYSPDGHAHRASIAKRALAAIAPIEPATARERAAKAVFTERLGLDVELHKAGLDIAELNAIASPAQEPREIFDLMPTETVAQWENVAARLAAVPAALDGVRVAQLAAANAGRPAALRQVRKVAEQAEVWAGLGGAPDYFGALVAKASALPQTLRDQLTRAARTASEAYAELAGFFRAELAPLATSKDAVGADEYRLRSRYFTGAALDPVETYEWGWAEFTRIEQEMREVGARILPGARLDEVAAALDADPKYRIHGREHFKEWLQRLSDDALHALRDKHFVIPDPIMALRCEIAPAGGSVGAYYTPPSADFTRPGQMWWSLPMDRDEFSTWRETSIVYHEGVPGHHLQIATAVHETGLNSYQRLLAGTSGHAEGWALYAERLMRELDYLNDDGVLFGMLAEQLFRAGRVIVDFGMHLELPIPAESGFHPGRRWTPELGLEFMLTRTVTDPAHVHDEIDRYLGWPGQAPAYKVGERLWLAAREDARRKAGASFDLKEFHTKALRLGGMGLDTLRAELAELIG